LCPCAQLSGTHRQNHNQITLAPILDPAPWEVDTGRRWRTGLCACCATPGGACLCLRAFACPCLVLSENVRRLGPSDARCGGRPLAACCAMCVLLAVDAVGFAAANAALRLGLTLYAGFDAPGLWCLATAPWPPLAALCCACPARRAVRRRYGLRAGWCGWAKDCAASWLCLCCALVQVKSAALPNLSVCSLFL
jgi:Cys-rich protein (TIGR01571 family)